MTTNEKAQGIFDKFCSNLSKVDLRLAVAVPAAIGVVTALYGVGQEVHGQGELLRHGGAVALDAYEAAMQAYAQSNPDSMVNYVERAFQGQLPSFGGNAQGIGFGVMTGGAAISGASVLMARGFEKMKEWLNTETAKFGLSAFREVNGGGQPVHESLNLRMKG